MHAPLPRTALREPVHCSRSDALRREVHHHHHTPMALSLTSRATPSPTLVSTCQPLHEDTCAHSATAFRSLSDADPEAIVEVESSMGSVLAVTGCSIPYLMYLVHRESCGQAPNPSPAWGTRRLAHVGCTKPRRAATRIQEPMSPLLSML